MSRPISPKARAGFTWSQARGELAGLPGGGLNMAAHEAVDRHVAQGRGDRVALCCIARDNAVSTVTYADLAVRTSRFADLLRSLGIGRGDRVFTLLGRCPELYTAVLGTLKNTSVLCPLFSAFGPDPVEQRLRLGDARVLVTTATLYRRKVAQLRSSLPLMRATPRQGPYDCHARTISLTCGSSPRSANRSTPRPCCGAGTCWVCRSTTTGGRPRPDAS
ncbi:AMP-binding protein [Streptomyces sp. NPDC019645]|uniref:AMP-binding protein n=1 Tax=Streptomyces sp. NPDC019645 TaxID=3154786 RepID=UPI0033D85172